MAEAAGLAASVIAISAKVAVLCLDYSTAVSNARADITRLRSRLYDLGTTPQGVRHLFDDPSSQALATSRRLVDSVDACTSELAQLQSRLDPGKARKAMRRFGIRALKWPFDSKVSDIVSNLERYERTITLGLQIGQTTLLLDIRQRIEGVSLQPEEDLSIARKPCFSLPFERDPDFVDRPMGGFGSLFNLRITFTTRYRKPASSGYTRVRSQGLKRHTGPLRTIYGYLGETIPASTCSG
ncbi:hypothetical protein EDB81DRAFT_765805 [Dactylonectria macrodidyma]|uniref:Fungal N-terminal domain-containing protein n=1 Tax=Dactylonectria macrodidyma TaxID=307937 RepID=A0A9P9DSG9_9HYPO|nr:hypothetical protein EDB81DRAFT_765805 [Dactylonectria macrodidyma]